MANNLTLSVTLTGDGRQLTGTLRNAQGEVREFGGTTERESARAERALEGTGQQAQTVSGHLNQLRTVAIGVGAALTAMGVSSFANDTYQAVSSSQQLQASLKTVTGSIANASAAWNTLLGFAAETPFTLDQSVQAFIRMQSLGLKPSQEALRSYGNTAAAMGKDMMQMVEAVADATTGEFERLKEFGIRASKEGEQVSFTFQGVTTTVANSASAISQYLQEIGELQFAGAMADQMDTLSGKASNLEDTIYQFYLAIGDAGATGVFEATLANASSTVQFLTDNIDTLASGAEILAVLVGGRVAVALTTATTAMVAKTLATQADLRAEAAAAVANTRRTAAEKQTALALLSTARLEAQATQGTAAHTFALQQLSVARTRAATAAGAHTAAMNTATAATARASVAARGLSGALALVGGPLGLLVGGAGLLYLFRDELGLTVPQVDANTTAVNKLTNGLDDMSQAAAQLTLTSLVGQLAEVRAQAEVTAEAFTKVGQIEGDGGGGFLGVDVTAQTNAVRELGETSNATQQEAANLEAAIALVESRIGQLGERNREVTPTVTEIGDASETAAAKAKEMAKAASEQADAIEALRNRMIPHRRETVQLAQDQNTLNLAFAMGRITASEYLYMIGALQTAYIEAQNDADDLATSTTNALYTMEGAMEELRTNGLRRLDDGFADLWQGAIDGSLNASEIMKRVISQTLAEMAHMAITRPITVQLATSMGLGGGTGSTGAGGFDLSPGGLSNAWNMVQNGFGGNSIGQGITSVARSGYGALTGNAVSYGGTGWASSATAGNASWLNNPSNVSNISFGLQSIGGSYAGNELGSSMFGKQANSNIGATVGAIAGSFLPIPGGTFIGSTLGGMVDSLFGSGKKTFDFDFLQGQHSYVFGDRTSAFGDSGLTALSDYKLGEQQDQLNEMLTAMAEFDNQLAAAAIPERFEAMKASIHGFTHSGPEDLFETRLRALITGGQVLAADAVASIIDPERLSQAALGALQLEGIGQQLGEQALSDITAEIERFSGDSVVDAIARMTNAAMAADLLASASQGLNLQFDVTAAGAVNAAGSIAEMVGGMQNLTAIQQGYYQAAYSETERLSRSQAALRESLSSVTDEVPTTVEQLRAMVEAQDLNTEAGGQLAYQLMQLAPAMRETNTAVRHAIEQQYQDVLGRTPDTAGLEYWFDRVASGSLTLEGALWNIANSSEAAEFAASGASNALGNMAQILREREQLERQLLQLQGDTNALRRLELEDLDPSNRALQRRIWNLQYERDAMQAAERAQQERIRNLERETRAMMSAGQNIRQFVEGLQNTGGAGVSPETAYQNAESSFLAAISTIYTSDDDTLVQETISGITGMAQQYLSAAEAYGASGSIYQQALGLVEGSLDDLAGRLGSDELTDIDPQLQAMIDQLQTVAGNTGLAGPLAKQVPLAQTFSEFFGGSGSQNYMYRQLGALAGIEAAIRETVAKDVEESTPEGRSLSVSQAAAALRGSGNSQLASLFSSSKSTAQHAGNLEYNLGGLLNGESRGLVDTVTARTIANALDFDESRYFTLNEDVAAAVARGEFASGLQHFVSHGLQEGRKFANGGVFTNGIVNEPTLFDMGLMGEAGSEAIMPLTRHSNGSLGVRAELPPMPQFPLLNNNDALQVQRDLIRENQQLREDLKRLINASNKHLEAANVQRGAAATQQIAAIERSNKFLKRMEDDKRLEAVKR